MQKSKFVKDMEASQSHADRQRVELMKQLRERYQKRADLMFRFIATTVSESQSPLRKKLAHLAIPPKWYRLIVNGITTLVYAIGRFFLAVITFPVSGMWPWLHKVVANFGYKVKYEEVGIGDRKTDTILVTIKLWGKTIKAERFTA